MPARLAEHLVICKNWKGRKRMRAAVYMSRQGFGRPSMAGLAPFPHVHAPSAGTCSGQLCVVGEPPV